MKLLWIINLTTWGIMLVYMAPGAWSAASGRRVRRNDPMRLACFATGFMMSSFSIRWLFFPENYLFWASCYILSAADAVYIMFLAKASGRGDYVGE